MKLSNFLNKMSLTVKIWILHTIIYYMIFNFIYQFYAYYNLNWTIFRLDFLAKILFSPIAGAIGLFDGFPLFVLIPITIMNIMVLRLKLKHFVSYSLSLLITYLFPYAYKFIENDTEVSFYRRTHDDYFKIDTIFILVPALTVAILINWLIFKKTYKKNKPDRSNM